MEIGTKAAPYASSVEITVHSSSEGNPVPFIGSKMLAVTDKSLLARDDLGARKIGKVDLHGMPVQNCVRLRYDAHRGDDFLVVTNATGPIDIQPGDELLFDCERSAPRTHRAPAIAARRLVAFGARLQQTARNSAT